MAKNSGGNCYLCGATLGKIAMKNHLLKAHAEEEGGQECRLLKVEGVYDKDYWLFIDVPVEKTLSPVDGFLRRIWLECCGHLSNFCVSPYGDTIGMSRKVGGLAMGTQFYHLYDYGTTTETMITVVGTTRRKPQRNIVRLLSRNVPPVFKCEACGKPADFICERFVEPFDKPSFCAGCAEKREDDEHFMHPITNSPRMGQCAYDGELDIFEFDPCAIAKT